MYHSQDEETVLRDRTFMEQMKADILRRAEAISDSSEDEDSSIPTGRVVAYEEELDEDGHASGGAKVKVLGDGEESGDDDDEGEEEDGHDDGVKQAPETILELAYIRDVALFERDAATRRGKGRLQLKEATGASLLFC